MKLLLRQMEVSLGYDDAEVIRAVAKRLNCSEKLIKRFEIVKRSLDARPKRSHPVVVLALEVEMDETFTLKKRGEKDIELMPDERETPAVTREKPKPWKGKRPVVVGAGPAGLMAALTLAEIGMRPILIERGGNAEKRKDAVKRFWQNGDLDPENNVFYGEGGAGLFSDGKLTARSKDRPRIRRFLETLVTAGAPPEILVDSQPHLGSDVLMKIVPNLRHLIEEQGGEIRYNTALADLWVEQGKVAGIRAGETDMETDAVILATGHSARDVYRLLANKGVPLAHKPFAVGVRLEIPQDQIDRAQYGGFAGHKRLSAASFRLTRRAEGFLRACYSFCMCPGGLVIACASEPGTLTTNGMSFSGRDGIWANAGFIVPIEPADFRECKGPETRPELAGLNFQRQMETAAFTAGGGNFSVPALMLEDFLQGKISSELPPDRSCIRSNPVSFDAILPELVLETLRHAISRMLKELNGITPESAVVYAAETRSSSPVRVLRDDSGQSPGFEGLFPAGEGAGYAGGIVSSAVDGMKAAELVMEKNR